MTYALATTGYICLNQGIAAQTGPKVKPSSLRVLAEPLVIAKLQVIEPVAAPSTPVPPPAKPSVCVEPQPCSYAVASVGNAVASPDEPPPSPGPGVQKPVVKVHVPRIKVRP